MTLGITCFAICRSWRCTWLSSQTRHMWFRRSKQSGGWIILLKTMFIWKSFRIYSVPHPTSNLTLIHDRAAHFHANLSPTHLAYFHVYIDSISMLPRLLQRAARPRALSEHPASGPLSTDMVSCALSANALVTCFVEDLANGEDSTFPRRDQC